MSTRLQELFRSSARLCSGKTIHLIIGRLQPRLPLQKQTWQQSADIRRHAREIATALIDLFGLDPDSIREDLLSKEVVRYDGELQSYGGDLLGIVLERIRNIPSKPGEEDFSRKLRPERPIK